MKGKIQIDAFKQRGKRVPIVIYIASDEPKISAERGHIFIEASITPRQLQVLKRLTFFKEAPKNEINYPDRELQSAFYYKDK